MDTLDQPKDTPVTPVPKSAKATTDAEKMDTSAAEESARKGEALEKTEEGSGKKGEESGKKGEGSGKKEENKKAEPEPNFELLSNPARVLPQQVCMLCVYVRSPLVLIGLGMKLFIIPQPHSELG